VSKYLEKEIAKNRESLSHTTATFPVECLKFILREIDLITNSRK